MKILVVEDSSSMRAYLTDIIEGGTESYHLEIVEAASGFEALKTLPHHKFDAILTDINMPDINGLELASFLKTSEKHASVPLVIVSTEGAERDIQKGLGIGADAYLVKPFDPEALRQIVLDLLAGRAQER